MKIFLVSCAIFIAAYNNPVLADNHDLNTIAVNEYKRTQGLKQKADLILTKVSNMKERVDNMAIQTDFGISKYPQIIELEKSLNSHPLSKELQACRTQQRELTQKVKNEVESSLQQFAVPVLRKNSLLIEPITKDLSSLLNDMEKNIDNEVAACKKNPSMCKITNDYPKALDSNERKIQSIDAALNSLTTDSLKLIKSLVAQKIANEIYPPVNECIKKLKV